MKQTDFPSYWQHMCFSTKGGYDNRWMHRNLYTSDPWDWFCPKSTSQVISSTSDWKLSSPQSNVEVGFYYVDYCVGHPFRLGLSKATFTLPTQLSHIIRNMASVLIYFPTAKANPFQNWYSDIWWVSTCQQKTYIRFVTIWVFPKIGVPQNGWFMENPIKMDDLGEPLFLETPILAPSLACFQSSIFTHSLGFSGPSPWWARKLPRPQRLLLQLPPTPGALNLCHHLGQHVAAGGSVKNWWCKVNPGESHRCHWCHFDVTWHYGFLCSRPFGLKFWDILDENQKVKNMSTYQKRCLSSMH